MPELTFETLDGEYIKMVDDWRGLVPRKGDEVMLDSGVLFTVHRVRLYANGMQIHYLGELYDDGDTDAAQ